MPDYRRRGWNRVKWTRFVIATAFVASAVPPYLLLKAGVSGHTPLFVLFAGMIVFPTVTQGILWFIFVRPIVSHDIVEKSHGRRRALRSMSHIDFESEVARVFEALFDVTAEVCGGSGDGGIDIRLYKNRALVGIVQTKNYDPSQALAPSFIRDLHSCKEMEMVDRAFLVTTASFSSKAIDVARERGITLIDGAKFERMRRKIDHKETP